MGLKITHLSEVPIYLGVLYFYFLNLAALGGALWQWNWEYWTKNPTLGGGVSDRAGDRHQGSGPGCGIL